jgi:hypothetical protein
VSIALTIAMPIVFHYDMSDYDYRITICFAGFHLTYYVLFYGFVWLRPERLISILFNRNSQVKAL